MSKKEMEKMNNPGPTCAGKDTFERMNYLYQASRLMAQMDNPTASYFGNIMVNCAKKAVLRLDLDIKRNICKGCQLPMIPGETAKIRLVSKPAKSIKWSCLICKTKRQIMIKKDHKLWIENPQSINRVFDFSKTNNSNNQSKKKIDE